MNILFLILVTTFLISLIAFIGALTLFFKEKFFEKILLLLVALSAGALIGGAFLHLIPESIEMFENFNIFLYVLFGFILFFFIEKILHWRHCHYKSCDAHKISTFAQMNLVGEGVHNFIDGLIISASFMVDVSLGITTAFVVALHEIPQEISDFGVLVYGGYNKIKALILNFSIALMVVLGGLVGYFLIGLIDKLTIFLLPFAAGGFIYIAASDLIPEIRKETSLKKSLITFSVFLLGILMMFGIKFL
jgi:zinc and cadmium transporter